MDQRRWFDPALPKVSPDSIDVLATKASSHKHAMQIDTQQNPPKINTVNTPSNTGCTPSITVGSAMRIFLTGGPTGLRWIGKCGAKNEYVRSTINEHHPNKHCE